MHKQSPPPPLVSQLKPLHFRRAFLCFCFPRNAAPLLTVIQSCRIKTWRPAPTLSSSNHVFPPSHDLDETQLQFCSRGDHQRAGTKEPLMVPCCGSDDLVLPKQAQGARALVSGTPHLGPPCVKIRWISDGYLLRSLGRNSAARDRGIDCRGDCR